MGIENKNNVEIRYDWLDLLKTISIMGVCYCHYGTLTVENNLMSANNVILILVRLLACTSVPIFFMVNGALVLSRDYSIEEMLNKAKKLFLKLLFWVPFTAAFFPLISNREWIGFRELIKRTYNWQGNGVQHLWFLFTLITLYLFFPFIDYVYNKANGKVKYFYYFLIFILTVGNSTVNLLVSIFRSYRDSADGILTDSNFFNGINFLYGWYSWSIVYFILGGLLLRKEKLRGFLRIVLMLLAVMSVFFYVFSCKILGNYIGDSTYQLYFWGYNQLFMVVIGIAIFCCARAVKLPRNSMIVRVINTIGRNTLGILFFHRFIGEVSVRMWKCLGVEDIRMTQNFIWGIANSICVMLISLIISLTIKKVRWLKWLV